MARARIEVCDDSTVETEIEALKKSKYVKLASKEMRLRARARKYLYQLRWMEKKGLALAAQGYTLENIEERMTALEKAIEDCDSMMEEE